MGVELPSVRRGPTNPIEFSGLTVGARARVVSLERLAPDQADRLAEMGLLPGTEFSITKIAPLGDPVEVEFRGYRLCLRRRETQALLVEVQPG
jgi:ferrous iron transport protein A